MHPNASGDVLEDALATGRKSQLARKQLVEVAQAVDHPVAIKTTRPRKKG